MVMWESVQNLRTIRATNESGVGLPFEGHPFLSSNAMHFKLEDLHTARCTYELSRRKPVFLYVDCRQMGAVGDNSRGSLPHPPYPLPAHAY